MKIYKKETVQQIHLPIEKCWDFFSSPENLQKITPPDMGFEITDFDGKKTYSGQLIQYNVSPIAGIKLKWVTIITVAKENDYFIDEQRFGPYVLWHHKHFFESNEKGTKMTDIVHYAIPFGIIGRIMNRLFIKKKIDSIFEYRKNAITKIMNNKV